MTGTRVRYREGQVLRAADLTAEQAYRRELRRRHNIAHHGWGIVRGLDLAPAGLGIAVQPGMAIDGYGRELVLTSEEAVTAAELEEVPEDPNDPCVRVWLIACDVPDATGCGDPRRVPGRGPGVREEARVYLSTCDDAPPREPVEVPGSDLEFAPHRPLPEGRLWPVFLGRVTANGFGEWRVDSGDWERPYASLNGWRVANPKGDVALRIGGETTVHPARFAVAVDDAAGTPVDRLAIDRGGTLRVRGDVDLVDATQLAPLTEGASDLVVRAPGAVPVGIAWTEPVAPPEQALPWRVYRTTVKVDGQPVDELRVEIRDPGQAGDPARSLFAIGHHDGSTFVPCLTVMADCTVWMAGDPIVTGRVIPAPVVLDSSDPDFARKAAEALAEGTLMDILQQTPTDPTGLALSIEPAASFPAAAPHSYTVTVRNTTGSVVAPVVVYSTITVADTTRNPKFLVEHPSLSAASTSTADDEFAVTDEVTPTAASGTEIRLAVLAVGVGPGPVIVSGTIERVLTVL